MVQKMISTMTYYRKSGKLIFNELEGDELIRYTIRMANCHTVVMGMKTWALLDGPVPFCRNVVLTRSGSKTTPRADFMTFEEFKADLLVPSEPKRSVAVVGGYHIFKLFIEDECMYPELIQISITETTAKTPMEVSPRRVFDTSAFGWYDVCGFGGKFCNTRVVYYKHKLKEHQEYKYLRLMFNTLNEGVIKTNRTGVDTYSMFGESITFDISNWTIPLMTTKRVSFDNILEELLWFCRGETNSKILEEKGVNIWKGNSTREFLDARGLTDLPEGELGEIYGKQWRNFGDSASGFDQLEYVENLLRTDPQSRRIMISAWNPNRMFRMALPPCHFHVGWYVVDDRISCYFTMRSSDQFLAVCYNVVSYTILTYILAKRHGLKPDRIRYNAVDSHLYKTHVDALKKQLDRNPRPFPYLKVSDVVNGKEWGEISKEDFQLVAYYPHPAVAAVMAV
jgi:thymidylate synthase